MFVSVCFVVAAGIWLVTILPWALRDIWRPTRYGEAPPQIVLPPESGPLPPGESINDRVPPTRW